MKPKRITLPWMNKIRYMKNKKLTSTTTLNRLKKYGESEEERLTKEFAEKLKMHECLMCGVGFLPGSDNEQAHESFCSTKCYERYYERCQ